MIYSYLLNGAGSIQAPANNSMSGTVTFERFIFLGADTINGIPVPPVPNTNVVLTPEQYAADEAYLISKGLLGAELIDRNQAATISASVFAGFTGNGDDTFTLTISTSAQVYTRGGVDNITIDGKGQAYVNAGAGQDYIRTAAGDDTLDGGAGADNMDGGAGNDTYIVDNAGDQVAEQPRAGIDTIKASIDFDLSRTGNVENLTLTGSDKINGLGNALDNVITGNGQANKLTGGAGDDVISGGAGWDRIIGGTGADTLTGGTGGDWFVYKNNYDYSDEGTGNIDRITDFNQKEGDRIDIVDIDGDTLTRGYQRFDFIGTDNFSGKAGELRYDQDDNVTRVMIDTDGDGLSNLTVELDGLHTVTMNYFVI